MGPFVGKIKNNEDARIVASSRGFKKSEVLHNLRIIELKIKDFRLTAKCENQVAKNEEFRK